MGKRKRVQQAAAIPLLLASIVAVTEQQATPWFSISDQNGATEKLEAWKQSKLKPKFEPRFKHPSCPRCRGPKRLKKWASNVYHDLCILDYPRTYDLENGETGRGQKDEWTLRKSVHVFNARDQGVPQGDFGVNLQTGAEAAALTGTVRVTSHQEAPPLPTEDLVAFFLGTTCEANFDHFLGDSLVYLHASAAASGMIPAKFGSTSIFRRRAVNSTMLFWDKDLMSFDRKMGPMGGFCHNPELFEDLLHTYGLVARPTAYWLVDRPICFKHAIFVGGSGSVPPREALTYAAGQMNIDKCSSIPQVTIFNRRGTRRILNAESLASRLRSVFTAYGLAAAKVSVRETENMSIAEQLHTARCSGLIIGVHGAALAWSAAMHPNAALVEISWNGWEFYYSCPTAAKNKNKGICPGNSKYGLSKAAFFRVQSKNTRLMPQHEELFRHSQVPRGKLMSASIDEDQFLALITELFERRDLAKGIVSWGTPNGQSPVAQTKRAFRKNK